MAITDIFKQVKALRQNIEDQIDDLERERNSLKEELRQLDISPRPQAELAQEAGALVDTLTESACADFAAYFQEKFRQNIAGNDINVPLTKAVINPQYSLLQGKDSPGVEKLLYFVAGAQIKEAVVDAFNTMPYPDRVGLPLAERDAKRETLSNQISKLNEKIGALLKQADEAGIAF